MTLAYDELDHDNYGRLKQLLKEAKDQKELVKGFEQQHVIKRLL